MDRVIKFFHPDTKVPVKKYANDAGYDCYLVQGIILKPYSSIKFRLGFGIQVKPGQMLTVRSRSSTKMRGVSCTETTIDSGYTGQIQGFLINHTSDTVVFNKGERVVQLVFLKLAPDYPIREGQFTATDRGSRGFGSTGKE